VTSLLSIILAVSLIYPANSNSEELVTFSELEAQKILTELGHCEYTLAHYDAELLSLSKSNSSNIEALKSCKLANSIKETQEIVDLETIDTLDEEVTYLEDELIKCQDDLAKCKKCKPLYLQMHFWSNFLFIALLLL
jgi:hypothetical protein